jgi:hypothetical protein
MVKTRNIIIIYLVLITAFVTSMFLSYTIPTRLIKDHVSGSISLFSKEGMHPTINLGFKKTKLDNFTDMLMLNMAVSPIKGNYLNESLNNKLSQIPPKIQGTDIDQLQSLKSSVNGKSNSIISYARYWHGYQIFLKPELVLLTYKQIRVVNMILLYILFLYTIFIVYKKLGLITAVLFTYSMLMVDILAVPLSIQFSSVFYIMLLGVILILHISDKLNANKLLIYIFFIIGCLTSFFDLLTAPLLTLGIPLIFAIMITNKKGNGNNYIVLIQNTILWILGYALTWSTKWIIATKLLKRDVIHDALSTLLFRVGLTQKISPIVTLYRNIVSMVNVPNIIIVLLLIFLLIKFRDKNKHLINCLPLLIVGIYPYIWFIILKNHSYEHFTFTYRIQGITLFSFMQCALYCMDPQRFHVTKSMEI